MTLKSLSAKGWQPPKPLVGLQVIEKVLNRHTFLVCPESRLVVAVIGSAIADCLSLSNKRQRNAARRFVLGADLGLWCDLVGLHPDFVRRIARQAGYLADEKAHWQTVPVRVPIKEALEPDTAGHAHTLQPQEGLIHA